MPYCYHCGAFEISLKPLKLCQECYDKFKEKKFLPYDIEKKKLRITKLRINSPILYYQDDLIPHHVYSPSEPVALNHLWRETRSQNRRGNQFPPQPPQPLQPQNGQHPQNDRSWGSDTQRNNMDKEVNENEFEYISVNVPVNNNDQRRNFRGQQRPYHPPANFQTHLKSNIALILLLISFIMPMAISIVMELVAVALAIIALREEPRNWRQPVIIVIGIFLIIMQILAIIYYDEIMAWIELVEQQEQLE